MEENAQLINEVSEAATKEFEIEKGLNAINEKWELTVYEVAPHKEKGHYKIKSFIVSLLKYKIYGVLLIRFFSFY